MAKLLYIEASPRKQRSASIAVAKEYLAAYQAAHPQDTVEVLDLWAADLPRLDETTLDARYAVGAGQPLTPEQEAAWQAVVKVVEHFKSADRYLFSVPMWNFSIPYILKHYLDAITHPGLTFGYTPEKGYFGLVPGKKATVIYARGGAYAPGTPGEAYDLQSRYLNNALGFIGITDVSSIFVEPVMIDKETALCKAKAEAVRLAAL